ncbi:CynX/NimT family MFS transporter [Nocardia fusca]|uniref:CynX/NimT family MFS transporter n=1 Tax=Nocardia fusca TaxID=941183 RepID=UPI0007A761C2|nr:MFS transporter [Nocardia fusca]
MPGSSTLTKPAQPSSTVLSAGLVIAILLVAVNLRVSLTVVGPLLPDIERTTGMTAIWGGALSTLPLLTFAATSPFVGRASHRFGSARVLTVSLGVLAIGTIVRSIPSAACLFLGTVILAAAIAFGNVLLPSVIRHHVPPAHIHTVSALYVTAMGLVAAISSGIAVPLADALPGSWRSSLAWGAIFAIAAIAAWLPRVRVDRPHAAGGNAHHRTPWRSWLAWQVSVFMGFQALCFYTALAWLPSILAQQGMSTTQAGWMLFIYQVVALVSSLALPLMTRGRQDQRYTAAIASALVAGGFALLLTSWGLAILACTLMGLGGGALLVLALSFQSQRANGAAESAALAGMAQSIGYLIAAAGPLLLGILHDTTHNWTASLVLLVATSLAMAAFGYGAGRNKHIQSTPAAAQTG